MSTPTKIGDPPTPRQAKILEYWTAYWAKHGRPPTIRRIGKHFGINGPNGVVCHLKALKRKGLLRTEGEGAGNIDLAGSVVARLKALRLQATAAEWAEFVTWAKKLKL